MLWPFNHFRKPRVAPRGTIEAIYGMIVTQAREPVFYRELGVPDTVNGRFDMLLLHLWIVLQRLKSAEAARSCRRRCSTISASIWTTICARWGSATSRCRSGCRLSARHSMAASAAYDSRLDRGREALAQALCKNILNGEGIEKARQLAAMRGGDRCPRGSGCRGAAAARHGHFLRRQIRAHRHEQNERSDRSKLIPGVFPSQSPRFRRPGYIVSWKPIARRVRRWLKSLACAKSCRQAPRSMSCRRVAAAFTSQAASRRGSDKPAW